MRLMLFVATVSSQCSVSNERLHGLGSVKLCQALSTLKLWQLCRALSGLGGEHVWALSGLGGDRMGGQGLVRKTLIVR